MKRRGSLRRLVPVALVLAAACRSGTALAECPYDWKPGYGFAGPNGDVNAAVEWDPDGPGPESPVLVVGGNFTIAGEVPANNVATWDGATWRAIGNGTNGVIRALIVYRGALIAAGEFTMADGNLANRIARWNGSTWEPLGGGFNYTVQALAVHHDDLVAAGEFWSCCPEIPQCVARWDGERWYAMGQPIGPRVYALAVVGDQLYMGGGFTNDDNHTSPSLPRVRNIARWDGSYWQPMSIASTGPVYALTEFGGELIAAGDFAKIGGVLVWSIARWNGSAWYGLGSGLGSSVRHLQSFHGQLLAGGNFSPIPSPAGPIRGIAAWDGLAWKPPAPNMTALGVMFLATFNDQLYAGGTFYWPGARLSAPIVRWNGETWQPLGLAFDGYVTAFAEYGGELIFGGSFNGAGGFAASGIIAWNGAHWHTFKDATPGSIQIWAVSALVPFDGSLIAANSSGVVEWNGTSWTRLGGVFNYQVTALAVYKGEPIAGGEFTNVDGLPVAGLARWDGARWQPLGGGIGGDTYSKVSALLVYNEELVVGGYFATAGDSTIPWIARWNGKAWLPIGAGLDGSVVALTRHDGDLIAAGYFASAGGTPASNIARWNGHSWHALGSGLDGGVLTLMSYNGSLIAGGFISYAGGVPANLIARWDGQMWLPMGNGLTSNENPYYPAPAAMATYKDDLVVGGFFTAAGGNPSRYWARWGPTVPPATIIQQPASPAVFVGKTATFSVKASGEPPLTYQWRKDGTNLADNQHVGGATTAMLTIHPVRPKDLGNYDVVVTNNCRSVTSTAAPLTIRPHNHAQAIIANEPTRD